MVKLFIDFGLNGSAEFIVNKYEIRDGVLILTNLNIDSESSGIQSGSSKIFPLHVISSIHVTDGKHLTEIRG